MKSYRLNRLFNAKSARCFDVAIDHGFFNERGFLQGIEDMGQAVKTVVSAAPDAIQLTIGQAHYLQSIPGREKPSLVLRTDVANVYGSQLPRTLFSRMIDSRSSRRSASTRPASSSTCSASRASPRSWTSASRTSSGSSPIATATGCR